MAFSTVNLVCDYNHPDGTNADGTVAFELTHAIADTDGNVISPRVPITTTLVSGSSTVSLYATNDATTEPTGVTYKVTETISGAATRVYEVTLTSSPTTQYLADLTPSTTTPSYSYLLDPAGKVDNYVLTVDSSSALGYKWAVSSGGGGGVTDHGALTGLIDNDHPQYVLRSNNLSDLVSSGAARVNLALGTAALVDTGTGATNAILGNDSRLTDSRAPTGSAGGDLTGTYPSPSVVAATTSAAGKVELATTAEATGGTDTSRAVVSTGLIAAVSAYNAFAYL